MLCLLVLLGLLWVASLRFDVVLVLLLVLLLLLLTLFFEEVAVDVDACCRCSSRNDFEDLLVEGEIFLVFFVVDEDEVVTTPADDGEYKSEVGTDASR